MVERHVAGTRTSAVDAERSRFLQYVYAYTSGTVHLHNVDGYLHIQWPGSYCLSARSLVVSRILIELSRWRHSWRFYDFQQICSTSGGKLDVQKKWRISWKIL